MHQRSNYQLLQYTNMPIIQYANTPIHTFSVTSPLSYGALFSYSAVVFSTQKYSEVLSGAVYLFSVSKALQDFDLALRGTKKRQKFLKDGTKKKELTVN